MIVAAEYEQTRTFKIERNVKDVRKLVQEMRRISALVASTPVIRAAHIGAHSNSLIGPTIPLPVCVHSYGNGTKLLSRGRWLHKQHCSAYAKNALYGAED
jgi:hypothetical protein